MSPSACYSSGPKGVTPRCFFCISSKLRIGYKRRATRRSNGETTHVVRMWISNQGRNCLAKQLLLWYPLPCTNVNMICLAARQIQDMCHENAKTITDSHCMCRLFLFELSNTFCILNTHRQASRRFLPRKCFQEIFVCPRHSMLQQMQTLHFLMTLLRCRKMRSADQFVSKLHKRMAKIKRERILL